MSALNCGPSSFCFTLMEIKICLDCVRFCHMSPSSQFTRQWKCSVEITRPDLQPYFHHDHVVLTVNQKIWKENLVTGDKIGYISGLTRPILMSLHVGAAVHTNKMRIK